MESDDDETFLVVVGDDIDKSLPNCLQYIKVEEHLMSEDSLDNDSQDSYIAVSIKDEPYDEEISYLAEKMPVKQTSDEEHSSENTELNNDCVKAATTKMTLRKRSRKIPPAKRHSYVQSLRKLYPELRKDNELLVESLVAIMKDTKPPPLPRDYYEMDGTTLLCIECNHRSETIQVARRHYQEKHGNRYLYCLACGANFRSTTNLYKHEKHCDSADAAAVLHARAIFLGHKGRSRPFSKEVKAKPKSPKKFTAKRNHAEPAIRKYGIKSNYTQDALEQALRVIRDGASVRLASIQYKIPMSTLHNKIKNTHTKTVGRPSVFSAEEEKLIETSVCALCDCGVPLRAADMRRIIQTHLNATNQSIPIFTNNLPGRDWGNSFISRHPDLKRRLDWNRLKREARVDSVIIHEFFDEFEEDFFDVPAGNIYHFSETGFDDDLAKKRVIFSRDKRQPTRTSRKSYFTVVFCGNAEGRMLPPFFILQGDHTDPGWLDGAPDGSRMMSSDSGWLDLETFDEWFKSHFLPAISEQKGKKILIGDSLSSHLSISTIKLCNERNIKFICSVPNSGSLLAPLDADYFYGLEARWRKELTNSLESADDSLAWMPKKSVVELISRTIIDVDSKLVSKSLTNGFKVCGICPIDREEVLEMIVTFDCTKCSASYTSNYSLKAHTHMHDGARPYVCATCHRGYTSSIILRRHVRKHDTSVRYECDHCQRVFNVRAALVAHLDTHRPLKRFACAECDKRYAQRAALALHVRREHRGLPPPCACQLCPRRYNRMSLLKDHMKKVHGMSLMTRNMFFKALPTLGVPQVAQAALVVKADLEESPLASTHNGGQA